MRASPNTNSDETLKAQLKARLEQAPDRQHRWKLYYEDAPHRSERSQILMAIWMAPAAIVVPLVLHSIFFALLYGVGLLLGPGEYAAVLFGSSVALVILGVQWRNVRHQADHAGTYYNTMTWVALAHASAWMQALLHSHGLYDPQLGSNSLMRWFAVDIYLLLSALTLGFFDLIVESPSNYVPTEFVSRAGMHILTILLGAGVVAWAWFNLRSHWYGYEIFEGSSNALRNYLSGPSMFKRRRKVQYVGPLPEGDHLSGIFITLDDLPPSSSPQDNSPE